MITDSLHFCNEQKEVYYGIRYSEVSYITEGSYR